MATRLARALSDWLGTSLSPSLRGEDARRAGEGQQPTLTFRLDLDAIEALSPEREALWARLEKTSFLTTDEKRAAIGYDPAPANRESKYSPDQPRVPAGNGRESGRFGNSDGNTQVAANPPRGGPPKLSPKAPPTPPKPIPPKPADPPKDFKKPKSGQSGKDGAKDAPSWARESGERPYVGEDGKDFAKRLMDKKYPERNGKHDTGPDEEFSKIKKWADRHFE